jgi:hypothetical protein
MSSNAFQKALELDKMLFLPSLLSIPRPGKERCSKWITIGE